MSTKAYEEKLKFKAILHAFKSFVFYPKGYNGKTNKILMVNVLYSTPVINLFLKSISKVIHSR